MVANPNEPMAHLSRNLQFQRGQHKWDVAALTVDLECKNNCMRNDWMQEMVDVAVQVRDLNCEP